MIKINKIKRRERIYDINVKNNHNFFANNILVHNCTESWSLTKTPTKWKEEYEGTTRITTETDGYYHSCNLISVVYTNLVDKTEDFIKEVCFYAVYALDSSIDEGTPPVLEAKKTSEALRNIGVGAVGVGDYMAYNHKLYDSEDGQKFLEALIERLAYYCYSASIELAEETEPYPLFKNENYTKILGRKPEELNKLSLNNFDWVKLQQRIFEKGIRNFYIISLAPNSGTGILMWSSAGFLPVYNKEMVQTLGDLSLPILPRFIDKKYWGYKTKFQYHPKDIIKATSKISKWVDTGISMEMNISSESCKINEVSNAIIEGFLDGDLKTVYYSMTADQGCTDCKN